jgi:non-ribosomal peptide synthetase-like protein
MVSDGLSIMNAEMSSSSFKLCPVKIGERNYLGNDIRFPYGHRVGDNCLLATKVMVPIDGPLRENVGLLGAPCFEIPRVVDRDRALTRVWSEEARRERIKKKNVHNLVTMLAYLGANWLFMLFTLIAAILAIIEYRTYGVAVLLVFNAAMLVVGTLYYALLERATLGFKRLTPKIVSIYDGYFWGHERYWKFTISPLRMLMAGTPFRSLIWRLLGMKVGKKLYDDGATCFETTMAEVGDYVNLNEGTTLQGHSLEEGLFKSDRIRIGNGCTVGAGTLVHYGVTLGDDVVIDPDAFLMKGESPEAGSTWRGNPARAMRQARRRPQLVEVALPGRLEPARAAGGRP